MSEMVSTANQHYVVALDEAASKLGRVIVLPNENELLLDLDDEDSFQLFEKNVAIVKQIVGLEWVAAPSPSGDPTKRHVTVILERPVKDAFERILLQALLGSDRVHEVLSWRAASRGVPNPSVFFENPPDFSIGAST